MENKEQNKISEEKAQPFLFPANHRKGSTFFTHSKLSLFLLPLILFSFICSLFSTTADAATIGRPSNYLTLNQGLVGWWTFDGPDMLTNVRDRSGQGNHGSLIGQTSTTTVVGKLGQALSFDGVDDYVSLMNFPSHTNESISWWVNVSVLKNYIPIYGGGQRYALFSVTGQFVMAYSSGAGVFDSFNVVGGTGALSANQWIHFTLVSSTDGTNNAFTLYKNGSYYGQHTDTNGMTARNLSRLGSYETYMLSGSLDDVRIYNRALTAQEIKALYNSGAAKLGISSRTAVSDNLSEGLVGHWTFDGPDMTPNVRDRSGQGNHGNLFGQTSTTTAIGKLGQALSFDGGNDRVEVATGSSVNNLSALTASFWARLDSVGTSRVFVSKADNASGGHGWSIDSDSAFSQSIRFTVLGYTTSDLIVDSQEGVLVAGEWAHYTVTWDGSNQAASGVHIYKNGTELSYAVQTDGGSPSPQDDSGRALRMVQDSGYGSSYLNGSLDDVRIYNRALSADEVKQLYNETAGAKQAATPTGVAAPSGCTSGLTCGLVGHWTFDGPDLLTNVRDRSGQGNHGYLFGQTSTTTTIGKIGQALSFDGVDDIVDINMTVPNADISYAFWIKSSFVSAISRYPITWLTSSRWCRLVANTTNLYCTFANTSTTGNTATDVIDGRWHYIVVTNTSNTQYMYKDGVLVSGPKTEAVLDPGTKTRLGQLISGGSGTTYFSGSFDDVRIYNRALSADEVKQLYNLGR